MNPVENQQLCKSAHEALDGGVTRLADFPGLLKKMIECRVWESRKVRGKLIEFKSLREMVTSKIVDGGWQEDPKKIEAVIKDDPEVLTMWREKMKCQGGDRRSELAKSKGDNVTDRKETPKGNSKAYTLSRLKRETPDLFQAVCDGELSANAAAIKAGFRKKPTPLEIIKREWKKATTEQQAEFLEWMKVLPRGETTNPNTRGRGV